jgi:putative transposase
VDEGTQIEEVCRQHNIAKATYHRWRRKYGKMEMKDAKRLKELEKENTELKKIVADQMLNIKVLEAVNAKKW